MFVIDELDGGPKKKSGKVELGWVSTCTLLTQPGAKAGCGRGGLLTEEFLRGQPDYIRQKATLFKC